MTRPNLILVVALTIGTLVATASGIERDKNPNRDDTDEAKATDYQKEFAAYRSWGSVFAKPRAVAAEQKGACRPANSPTSGAGPHAGGFVHVYVNPTGQEAYRTTTRNRRFSEGTVIVKEKLDSADDDAPQELGIMIKRKKGYDPSTGDWQYLFVDADQQVTHARTKLSNCRTCHHVRAADDYVFLRVQPKAAAEVTQSRKSKVPTRSK